MFFCKNCSKLLDEDLKVCPYCGAIEEESILDGYSSGLSETENKTLQTKADTGGVEMGETEVKADGIETGKTEEVISAADSVPITGGNEIPPLESGGGVVPDEDSPLSSKYNSPGSYDNSLDATINKINEMIEKNQKESSSINEPENYQINSAATPAPSEQPSPQNSAVPPYSGPQGTASPPPYSGSVVSSGSDDISSGIKVGLILLAIFIPIAGIVFGAIYMSKTNPKHKSFGKIVLIISIVLTVVWLICCCGIFFFSMSDYFY